MPEEALEYGSYWFYRQIKKMGKNYVGNEYRFYKKYNSTKSS